MSVAGPAWLVDGLAVVMIATAVYCACHLVASWIAQRPAERDVGLMHVLMGVAMGGMLLAVFGQRWTGPWVLAFVLFAAWFGFRSLLPAALGTVGRSPVGAHLRHLLACGAMVYMFVGFSTPVAGAAASAHSAHAGMAEMAGMGGATAQSSALIATALAAALLCCAGWNVAELVAAGRSRGRPLAPRLSIGCQLVLSVTMGYLLIAS